MIDKTISLFITALLKGNPNLKKDITFLQLTPILKNMSILCTLKFIVITYFVTLFNLKIQCKTKLTSIVNFINLKGN